MPRICKHDDSARDHDCPVCAAKNIRDYARILDREGWEAEPLKRAADLLDSLGLQNYWLQRINVATMRANYEMQRAIEKHHRRARRRNFWRRLFGG